MLYAATPLSLRHTICRAFTLSRWLCQPLHIAVQRLMTLRRRHYAITPACRHATLLPGAKSFDAFRQLPPRHFLAFSLDTPMLPCRQPDAARCLYATLLQA